MTTSAFPLKMEVFVHSHADTGEPLQLDVFSVEGWVPVPFISWLIEQRECPDVLDMFSDLELNTPYRVQIEFWYEPADECAPGGWWFDVKYVEPRHSETLEPS